MTRKSFGYGAACYYAGKLVGRCTLADAQGYEQLMKACGGNAARVLQEYAYFSPELRGILEKVAAVQAKESRAAGIFQSPRLSPWGEMFRPATPSARGCLWSAQPVTAGRWYLWIWRRSFRPPPGNAA